MIYLTDGCRKIDGKWKCSDSSDKEPSWRDAYCTGVDDYNCHYRSAKEEIHVHVFAQLIRCRGLLLSFKKVVKVELWDQDSFLHLKDDKLTDCRLVNDSFVCH